MFFFFFLRGGKRGKGYSREELTPVCLVGKANLGSRHRCPSGAGGARHCSAKPRGLGKLGGNSYSCLLGSDSPSSASTMPQGCIQPGAGPHPPSACPQHPAVTVHALRGSGNPTHAARPHLARSGFTTIPLHRPDSSLAITTCSPKDHPCAPMEQHRAAKHQLCYSLRGCGRRREKQP